MAAKVQITYEAEASSLREVVNEANKANDALEAGAQKTSEKLSNTYKAVGKSFTSNFGGTQVRKTLDEQAKAFEQINKKATPLTRVLRGLKNEILALEEAGDVTSDRFRNLVAESARLEDQIGDTRARISNLASDTLKFDAGLQAVQGLAAGFEVVQGTAALFGAENEDLQKSLLKVQGAMAVANGLQQISNLLLEESKLKTVALTIAQRVYAGAVALTSGALKGLKVALAATGVGALLVALGAVVAYWDDIKGLITGVSAEQEKLNETTKNNLKRLDDELKLLELQENALKLQGKTEEDIIKLKQLKIQQSIQQTKIDIENAKTVRKQQVENSKLAFEVLQGIGRVGIELITIAFRVSAAGIDAAILIYDQFAEKLGLEKIGTTLNEQISKLNEGVTTFAANFVFDPEATAKEGDKAVAEAELRLAELESTNDGYTLKLKEIEKERTDNANAANKERADKASDAAKKAEEDAKKARERLAQIENEAFVTQLTEQQKVRAETNEKILDLEKTFTEARFKAGTVEALRAEKEKNDAIDQLISDRDKRIKELEKKDLEASVAKQIEATKAAANATTEEQILALQTQRDIELANAEALGKDKVEITTRYNTQIADLNKQLAQSEYNTRVDNLKALELIEGSTLDRRLELINIEAARRKKEATDTIKDKEELDAKLKLIEAETQAAIREERKRTTQETIDEALEIAQAIGNAFGSLADALKKQGDARIEFVQQAAADELEAINNSAKTEREKQRQREALELRTSRKVAEEKTKQARLDKQLALFNAIINTAAAIMKVGGPFTPIGALTAIAGAAQIATIAAQPIPKFAKGGLIGGRLHSAGGTLIEAERDEYIINRRQSVKHRRELDAINTSSAAFKKLIEERYVRPALLAYAGGRKNDAVIVNASLNSKSMEREIKGLRKDMRKQSTTVNINAYDTRYKWQ
jgi:hypothetical protein